MSSSITRYLPASSRESLDSTITAAEAVQENSIRIETLRTQPPCSESTISDAPVEHVASALGVEEELIFRVCGGDNEALTFLFRRYARLVRSVAYRVLRDPFEADDLLQEVFLMLPRKCSSFDSSKGSARVWILQIAYPRHQPPAAPEFSALLYRCGIRRCRAERRDVSRRRKAIRGIDRCRPGQARDRGSIRSPVRKPTANAAVIFF
jgi:hypothetical protein